MVRRKGTKRKAKTVAIRGKPYICKPTAASKAKYKKCLLSAIRGTKIVSRKGASKAFAAAAKKCNPLIAGVKSRKKSGRKGAGRRKMRRVTRTRRLPAGGWHPVSTTRMSKQRRQALGHLGGMFA